LIFELTLYWEERVVVLHFDLVLRREGHKLWINLWREGHKLWINLRTMSLRLYNRVECGDTILSHFSNNIFCWFAWSLILPYCKMYVGCMIMHEIFLFCSLWRMHLWMHEIWFFFVLIWILILFSLKKCIYECMKFDIFSFNMNFDFVLFEKTAYMNVWNLVNFLNESACLNALVLFAFSILFFKNAFMNAWNFVNFLNESACLNA